jgi:hypothetical protein
MKEWVKFSVALFVCLVLVLIVVVLNVRCDPDRSPPDAILLLLGVDSLLSPR